MVFRKLRFFILLVISATLLTQVAIAFTMSNPNYRIEGVVSSGGNDTLIGTEYKIDLVLGQPIINVVSGAYNICLGVFCLDFFLPVNQIKIKGQLFYDNGTSVSNSEIIANITYKGSQWRQTNKTDDNGNFFVRVNNIPEFIRLRQFKAQIFARGTVDALYECIYNPLTQKCS